MFFLYLISLLLTPLTTHSILHRYEQWQHPITKQQIHLFGDVHIDLPDGITTFTQAVDLEQFIEKLTPNCLVIAEDFASLAEEHNIAPISYLACLDKTLFINTSPMLGLIKRCQQNNIAALNAECRIPIISDFTNASIKPFEFETKRINDIQKWSREESNEVLKTYYSSVASGNHGWSQNHLVDAYIIKKLQIHNSIPHIIIVTGNNHTENIARLLLLLQYKKTNEHGINGTDLQNTISSDPTTEYFMNIMTLKKALPHVVNIKEIPLTVAP